MNKLKNIFSSWFRVDTRVLAIFRIFLGMICFWDVYRRYYLIDVFYSSAGIKLSPSLKYFSLLNSFQSPVSMKILFIVIMIGCISLLLGYKTKLSHFIAMVGLISIHNYRLILENGGDMAFNSFIVWSFFLPLGKSISIDSLICKMNNNKSLSTEDLNIIQIPNLQKYFHFAYFGFLLQLIIIYTYNFINKTGGMWQDGTAVYHMYQLDTFLTPFGYWFKSILNSVVNYILTNTTTVIESMSIFLIFPLFYTKWVRRIAFISFMSFHLMIGISVSIGMFSWIMMIALIMLLGSSDINYLKVVLSKFHDRNYTVFYDHDCGICHFTARLINKLDIFNRLKWADSNYNGSSPKDFKAILEYSIIVYDDKNNKYWTRHIAFSKIISTLPFGFLFSWILKIPLLEKLFGLIYDLFSRNRTKISILTGLPACGIPEGELKNNTINIPNTPLEKYFKNISKVTGNLVAIIFIIGVLNYSLIKNDGVEKRFGTAIKGLSSYSKELSNTLNKIILYPRMFQKWNMFSPTVMSTERWIVAEIEFRDGKDTLFINSNDIFEKFHSNHFNHRDQFWRKFFGRLHKKHNKKYIEEFKIWLKRTRFFPEYNGRRPLNITLWQLSERSPGMNATKLPKVIKRELKSDSSKGKKNKVHPKKYPPKVRKTPSKL